MGVNFAVAIRANREPSLGRIEPVTDAPGPVMYLGAGLGSADLADWMGPDPVFLEAIIFPELDGPAA